jgi:transcriptional regulator with PAS, ATPase and Fis domain
MAQKTSNLDSLAKLFDGSSRPIYAIDAERRIVYCNRALAAWLDIATNRILGRVVEYHSEPSGNKEEAGEDEPLTDLCPPPQVFAGKATVGTLSCMARDGRLVHRQAEFVPLGDAAGEKSSRRKGHMAVNHAVLAMLALENLSPQELAMGLSGESTADKLHSTIRRFRRAQASQYPIESLLGSSLAMQKVRAQLQAAAASGANTLICGPRGSGRGHAALAIHYSATSNVEKKLLPIDCELLSDDLLRRVLEKLRDLGGSLQRTTLLLENLERMSAAHQSLLASALLEKLLAARIIATFSILHRHTPNPGAADQKIVTIDSQHPAHNDDGTSSPRAPLPDTIDIALLSAISTITIEVPPLANRLEDLPILAQYFLEACNHGSGKQVGSFRSEALDLLALYSWPGELNQLRETVAAAHRAATSHEVSTADLPAVVQHASGAAKRRRREPERIVLDELLTAIEKEAIVRALSQAGGNKSEAAVLLGMTRPRLYRRLVQLGLVADERDESPLEQPEFIERDPTE